MIDFEQKKLYSIKDLIRIMGILRSDEGCPWDREQDHKSIRKNFLEETYEVLEAIDNEDASLLREELGDVLLQVVFHSQIEAEKNSFNFDDVADEVCKKLIERHPHVFGDISVENSSEVLTNWDNIKQKSKQQETYTETLKSIPAVLPALMRSYKVGQRAKRANMDFKNADEVYERMISETRELKEAMESKNKDDIFHEIGDVLFSCVNLARHYDIDPEFCLTKACERFIDRFEKVENQTRLLGTDMKSLSIDDLDSIWNQVKKV